LGRLLTCKFHSRSGYGARNGSANNVSSFCPSSGAINGSLFMPRSLPFFSTSNVSGTPFLLIGLGMDRAARCFQKASGSTLIAMEILI
jgi:hypothetical protein